MSGCLPIAPLNPVNELLLGIFGDNFFPPFNEGFQPFDLSKLTNEKLLQMKFPANATIKPPGDPKQVNIKGYISGIIGQLGPIFSFFGILFLILDLIRAIIDIICAMFNPEQMILAIVDLFLTVLPPIISLYPPLSTILLIINVIKMIVAIVVALVAAVIPLIDLIVQDFNDITTATNSGNINAVNSISAKLCTLFQIFGNEIGAFDPISFIVEMIKFFSSLGSKFFCASDSTCCDSTSCPPIITSPPSGQASVIAVQDGATLGDFVPLLPDDIAAFALGESTLTIKDESNQLGSLQNYIVDPATLPKTGSGDPATIRVIVNGVSWAAKSASSVDNTITLKITDGSLYSVGQSVSYEVVPDTNQLLTVNLISLGCVSDIRAASDGLKNQFPADALTPITDRAGEFPDTDDLQAQLTAILNAQQADPGTNRGQQVKDATDAYLGDLIDYYATIICLGANRVKSDFSVSSPFATADGKSFSTITFTIKDANNVALLANGLPNAQDKFGVQFVATFGNVGPVLFDSDSGTFQATITSDEIGRAEISAIFLVNGSECMRAGTTDGFSVVDKINVVEFISAGGTFAHRRKQRQYVQSAGGRRR